MQKKISGDEGVEHAGQSQQQACIIYTPDLDCLKCQQQAGKRQRGDLGTDPKIETKTGLELGRKKKTRQME